MSTWDFYEGKRVLITGHTGFKGAWLSQILLMAGADLTGYALKPPTEPNLFSALGLEKKMLSVEGDIREQEKLWKVIEETQPELVLHLAAQPIVRESYRNPVYTYETNVMGTVNILEGIRRTDSVRSFLNVTTDKVYKNNEWEWGYRETDELDGYDPYSNSKSCSELVTHSYKNSFLNEAGVAVSTARAGNVIGGGDFAEDRIIPDCVPHSTRPYQHVLEPLGAYLKIVQAQYENPKKAGAYNVGPDDRDCITTGTLADLFCGAWQQGAEWENLYVGGPHEANFLKLDCSRIRNVLNWKPHWQGKTAVEKTGDWYQAYLAEENMTVFTERQIREYEEEE